MQTSEDKLKKKIDKLVITIVESPVHVDPDEFKAPSKYYFVDAMGRRNYMHTRDRVVAQAYINREYGGRYSLHTEGKGTGTGTGCRAVMNSVSRKGTMYKNTIDKQFTQ